MHPPPVAPHCCCLCCQVEEGTPFARWFSGEGSPLPKEPEAVAMFEAASATLTAAGYEHYEVGV
jgi:oxygen-independent coproporphyrinogen-3 oxidase